MYLIEFISVFTLSNFVTSVTKGNGVCEGEGRVHQIEISPWAQFSLLTLLPILTLRRYFEA